MEWLTVYYQGTQQTGPAKAIEAVCVELDDNDIDYEVYEYNMPVEDADVEDVTEEGDD